MMHVGDIMSASAMFSTSEGYHDSHDIMSTSGFSM